MTNYMPQEKPSELLNKVVDISKQDNPSEFLLMKYQREAENLKKTDAANSYLALGMIAALRKDPESMIANHEAALKLAPYDVINLANYATSLNRLCFFDKAISIIKQANEINSWSNVAHVLKFVEFCINSGDLNNAFKGTERALKICPDTEFEHYEFINAAKDFLESLTEQEAQDFINSAPSMIQLAADLARDKNIHLTSCDISFEIDESSSWISYAFDTTLTVDESIDLNVSLCDKLANYEKTISEKLVIRYA